jgi:hypothetical protein
MSLFEEVLRESVDRAQRALQAAQNDGRPSAATQHAARILDLLERARINGIDTTGWLTASARASVTTALGDTA